MVTNTDILHFALKNNPFTRKELIMHFGNQEREVSSNAISIQLDRLIKKHELIRIERGLYSTPVSTTSFVTIVNEEIQQLFKRINLHFPYINYCIWGSHDIIAYMRHVPNLNYIYVDVEREVAESVFNFLNDNSSKRVFIWPDQNEFNRYITGTDAIIVRTLVSEAPTQLVNRINTPTVEKILVDILGDTEFSFLQGLELNHVCSTIIERHNVNKNKLIRYATRRGRKEEVEQILR